MAILTLALGIGATTAIFSVVQGVVLAPLPYKEPDHLAFVLRTAVLQAGADQPIYDVRITRELAAQSMPQRFPMILMGTFAALALLLASIGTFGVTSYSVARRVQEIGVRMALSAEKSQVFCMIIGEGLGLALISVIIEASPHSSPPGS